MWELSDLKAEHLKILEFCNKSARKGKELLENLLGLSYQSINKRKYLKPLIDLGLLEFTDQSFLKSKHQKYKITFKGTQYLRMKNT
jgi:predicted transcriptional regulator